MDKKVQLGCIVQILAGMVALNACAIVTALIAIFS